MAQHDYDLANQAGAAFRADANNALAAIVGLNSGASAPSTTFAYMLWADTTNALLKQRNAANSGWITLFELGVDYPSFPSGTAAFFPQATAPTGWTKSTTHNDKAIRIVSGAPSSGGATAFTSVFGSSKTTGGHSITQAELPNCSFTVTDPGHEHAVYMSNSLNASGGNRVLPPNPSNDGSTAHAAIANATGISVSSGGSGTAHAHTLSLDLQYVDTMIATKD